MYHSSTVVEKHTGSFVVPALQFHKETIAPVHFTLLRTFHIVERKENQDVHSQRFAFRFQRVVRRDAGKSGRRQSPECGDEVFSSCRRREQCP